MRLKLEAITGVREAGERKLWDIIEGIYQDSNPTYIRRLKVYELQMIKGEQASDFATRLKLDYEESDCVVPFPVQINIFIKYCRIR